MMRTIQFLGQGYGSEPVTAVVKWANTVIHNGTVPTLNQSPVSTFRDRSENNEVLFTTEVDVGFEGDVTMEIQVTSGTLVVGSILANFCPIHTDISTPTKVKFEKTSSGVNGYDLMVYGNTKPHLDPRCQVKLNNTLLPEPSRTPEQLGAWFYTIPAGSTLTSEISISAGFNQ